MKFILISRYWDKPSSSLYKKKASNLAKVCKSLNIPFYIKHQPHLSKFKYQHAQNDKPNFILNCLQMFKCPVLYVDVDLHIHKYPYLFHNRFNNDCMFFNWNFDPRVTKLVDCNTLETSGWISYFNNSLNSKKLLRSWISILKNNKHYADDRMLNILYKKKKCLNWVKTQFLPLEYSCPHKYVKSIPKNLVISHKGKLTSEKTAMKDLNGISRIPSYYDSLITHNLKESKNIPPFHKKYLSLPLYSKLNSILNNYFSKKSSR